MLAMAPVLLAAWSALAAQPVGWSAGHDLEEPWSAPAAARAPRSGAVSLQHSQVFGPTLFGFTGLGAGIPLAEGRGHRVGVGIQVRGSLAGIHVPDEERGGVFAQALGGELDLYVSGRRPGTVHMARLLVQGSPGGGTRAFLMEPAESGAQVSLGYAGYVAGDRVDTAVDLVLGVSARSLLRGLASLHVLAPVADRWRFALGGTLAIAPYGVLHVWPTFEVKAYR